MCILHFTLFVEQECAEMRRESNLGKVSHERQQEMMKKVADRGSALVNVATSGFAMSDEIKARVLSTLLTLMTCRENMDRAAMRQSAMRRFVG
jgi:nicotinamide mononucleotide (NMN) deamidase PncC